MSVLLVAVAAVLAHAGSTPAAGDQKEQSPRVQQPAGPAAVPPQATGTKTAPAAAPPSTGPVADVIDLLFRKWADYLFGGVFGVALGFLAKWLLEQTSARIAARREFAKEVTKQISSLAEKHYWALANAAGVLAGQLEGYHASRTAHLVITWDSRTALRARLDELAKETGEGSFFHLCQMIWLFDRFQFQSSTTYLLTSHSAGDMCKRLYNMFVGSLPDDLGLAKIRELTEDAPSGTGAPKKLRDLPAGALTKEQISRMLGPEQEAYVKWLRRDAVGVSAAADALRAFNELLNHELALLYRVWFRAGIPFPEKYAYEQQFGQWPDLLTRQSADTLALAGYQSNLLRPLGSAGAAQPATSALAPPAQRAPQKPGGTGAQSGRADETAPALPPTP